MIKIKINKKKERIGSLVVILDQDNQALILLRPDDAHWAPRKWGFPGGKIEEGESPLHAAIRETEEETELKVVNLKIVTLKTDLPCVAYYTREYEGAVKIDHEHDDWVWAPRDKIEEYKLAPGVLEMYDWVLNNDR